MGKLSIGNAVIARAEQPVAVDGVLIDTSSFRDGEALVYDEGNGKIVTAPRLRLLDELENVNVSGAQNGDVLGYIDGVWMPRSPSLPGAHAATHEFGGDDEISVDGLSGRLADYQSADKIGPWPVNLNVSPQDGQVLAWNESQNRITWASAGGGGGGGSPLYRVWDPMAPPETPHELDDEFTSDLSGWIEFDPNNILTASVQYPPGWAVLREETRGGDNVVALLKPIPTPPFAYWTHVYLSGPKANYNGCGLTLFENLTTSGRIYNLTLDRGVNLRLTVLYFLNCYTYGGQFADFAWPHTSAYLRIRMGTGTISFDCSADGIGWMNIANVSPSFTPAYFGISMNNVNCGAPIVGRFKFFRVITREVDELEVGAGRTVCIYQ